MNLEKLGVLFLLNYFNQFGVVKNHLQLALKEVLLAVQTSTNLFHESIGKQLLGDKNMVLQTLFGQINQVLSYTLSRVEPPGPAPRVHLAAEGRQLKEHIVDSIIQAIDDEIEATSDTSNERNQLKIEALDTVKKVLLGQKTRSVDVPSPSASSPATHVA